MGIARERIRRQPDLAEEVLDLSGDLAAGDEIVNQERFTQQCPCAHPRIE